ncbi:MAG: AMP-binding protein, partial [bacterium]|nr:AMP-binding protein [bacterium]
LAFEIEPGASAQLKRLANETGATPFMMLLALFNLLLAKLSGQEDIIIGTPTAGRSHNDLENIIGVFINTLALRNFPSGEKRFSRFLTEVKETCLQAFENQDYQFETLVDTVVTKRDLSRNTLFDVMLVLQNIDSQRSEIPGLKLAPYHYESDTSKFDLTLTAVESGDRFVFSITYSTKLFKQDTIQRFAGYFKRLAANLAKDSHQCIAEIELLSEQEKQQILVDFNATDLDYPASQTIHQLFEIQVEETPNHIALTGENSKASVGNIPMEIRNSKHHLSHLTYRELNNTSKQLAKMLKEKGVMPGGIVALMADRTIDTVIGILGILKAGGAYLPIDPDYPEERINYMLRDSAAKVIITNDLTVDGSDGLIVKKLDGFGKPTSYPINQRTNEPTNPAYIIYTSGPTAKPKEVTYDYLR